MPDVCSEDGEGPAIYPVGVLRAGRANGLVFSARVLEGAVPLFEGAPVFVDHPSLLDTGRAGGRSVRDLAGVLTDVRWEPDAGELRGRVRLLSAARWLQGLVAEASERPFFGLSADLWIQREGEEVQEIRRVNSVDIVAYPAAGGRFLSAGPAAAWRERPRLENR